MFGRREHIVEDPIHPVADLELGLRRFDMNIARPVLNRLGKHQVNQLDDGCITRVIQEISCLFNFGDDRVGVFFMHPLDDLFRRSLAHVVGIINGRNNGGMGGEDHLRSIQA